MAAKNAVNPANENTFAGVQRAQRTVPNGAGPAQTTYKYDLVRVRATARGYYGLPIEVNEQDVNSPTGFQTGRQSLGLIRNVGEVFEMDAPTSMEKVDIEAMSKPLSAVGRLPRKDTSQPMMSRKDVLEHNGMWNRQIITEAGDVYILPSWVELADEEERVEAPKGHKTKHVPPVLGGGEPK